MAHGDGLRRNRCGVWCWRWVIPVDLRPVLGAREVSRSLETCSRREAVAASLPLRLFAFQAVKSARLDGKMGMSREEMLRLLNEAKLKNQKANAVEDREAELDAQQAADRLEHRIRLDAQGSADQAVDRERQQHDAEQKKLRQAATSAVVLAHQRGKRDVDAVREAHTAQVADLVATTADKVLKATAAGAVAVIAAGRAPAGPPLSDAVPRFVARKRASRSWGPKTEARWIDTLGLLQEHVGGKPINQVSQDEMVDFQLRLQRLPSNAGKKSTLDGLQFKELTAEGGDFGPVLADETVNGHMTRVSGFFKWACGVEDCHSTRNPAAGMGIKNPKTTERKPFTPDQLHALFSHENFRTRELLHSHYYWLMPIAALSGMRLNEICQLRLVDFLMIDGVHVISCADLSEGQKGKNKGARPRVPIHGELKRLGLLRWVEKLRASGEVQLFPELKSGRDGHGQAPSKWFQGYRERCGILGKQEHVFHSFRHYFVRQGLNTGEAPHNIAAVVGHETGLITIDIYGRVFDMSLLQTVVDKVTLPDQVMQLIPVVEEVTFIKKACKLPPSRLGVRKTCEKRIADAAARKTNLKSDNSRP